MSVAWALCAGCATAATSPHTALAPPGRATLDVANARADERVSILLDGTPVVRLDPGDRRRLTTLPAGMWELKAVGLLSNTTAHLEERVGPGQTLVWIVEPAPGKARVQPPAALGNIRVHNGLGMPLEVTVHPAATPAGAQPRWHRQVLAGDEVILADVPSGGADVEARTADGRFDLHAHLEVPGGGEVTWKTSSETASVRIHDALGIPVRVWLDDSRSMTVQPDAAVSWEGILPGVHDLRAEQLGGEPVTARAVALEAGEVFEWNIAMAPPRLAVVNALGVPLTLSVEKSPVAAAVVPPNERRVIEGLSAGHYLVRADARQAGGFEARLPVDLGPARTVTWVVRNGEATVRVVNATPEPLEVFVGHAASRRVRPGDDALFVRAPAGRVPLRAWAPRSGHRYETTLALEPGAQATWTVSEPTGALTLHNASGSPAVANIDGNRQVDLSPGEFLTLGGLPVGTHTVQAHIEGMRAPVHARVDVLAHQTATWTIPDVEAWVELRNATNHPLRPGPMLRRGPSLVAAGAVARYAVRPGRWRLEAHEIHTGLVHSVEVVLADGEVRQWKVEQPTGALHVFNRRPEPVRVWVDGVDVGTVEAGADRPFDGIAEGARHVVFEGLLTGYPVERDVVVKRHRARPVEVRIAPASLVVENTLPETVELSLDGRPLGRVEAESVRGFGRLVPGTHEIVAAARVARRTLQMRATFNEGAQVRWTVHSERAPVVVRNASGRRAVVGVDGDSVGALDPGATVRLWLDEGVHTVGDLAEAPERIEVLPGRTIEVLLEPDYALLDVDNPTPWDVVVRYLGGSVGVPAGGAVRGVHIPARPQLLDAEARSADPRHHSPRTRWMRPLHPRGGQRFEWRLEPIRHASTSSPPGASSSGSASRPSSTPAR